MINFRKRLRPHKTKSTKDKSSDDDEVDWVTAAVAVAGLGLTLWERHEQNKAQDKLKSSLQDKLARADSGFDSINQTLDASLGLVGERKEQDKDILTENMSSKLKDNLDKVRNSGSTLASSGADSTMIGNVDKTLWSGLNQGNLKLNRQEENSKLGAYSSAFSGAADLRREMSELESQINSLS